MNCILITELIENKWIKFILILWLIYLMSTLEGTFLIVFFDMDQCTVLLVMIGCLICFFNK